MKTFLLDAYMQASAVEIAEYKAGRTTEPVRFRSFMLLRKWCSFLRRKSKRPNGCVQRRVGVPGTPRPARKTVKASRVKLRQGRPMFRAHPLIDLIELELRQ